MIGGMAAGIAGARLVPLLAGFIGSRRTREGTDPFSLLIDDHRKLRAVLDRMIAAATSSAPERWRLFLTLKRKLAKHAMAEEDVVYPIVRNDSGDGDERKHLYDEHAGMKILLHAIEGDVKSGLDWTGNVTALRNLVLNHVEEEEKTIFPELRREIARSLQPGIAGQISREEAMVL